MLAVEIQTHARKLLEIHGTAAIAEAAQKASAFEKNGNAPQAETWRRIEAALLQLRGPRAS
ncbi:MAG: hypothetical protein ACKVP3_10815 [Hyphomicrobiaceae bacterium]